MWGATPSALPETVSSGWPKTTDLRGEGGGASSGCSGGATPWPAIATLYAHLQDKTGSRVVAVNRAMAIAEAGDLSEGLAMLQAVEAKDGLESFQPFWAARAELHARAGLTESATSAYDRHRP